jgi:phosphoribosylglycinamide formyltransferase-1
MSKLAIFSSGTGSNAARIIRYFQGHPSISIGLIVCNNAHAGVLNIASAAGVPVLLIEKEQFFRGSAYVPELQDRGIDFIVLAGFLWKIPTRLIQAYPRRIINIHPALLPKYGGKGMYGRHVHEAVIAAGEKESGITIHYVDEIYDHGQVIFQDKVIVDPEDTPESLAGKIQSLEHSRFPRVIEEVVKGLNPR